MLASPLRSHPIVTGLTAMQASLGEQWVMAASTAVFSKQKIMNFAELRRRAQPLGPKRVAVVAADDEVP
jgi:hypothetical protein